jgi:hypothetical protein
MKIYLAGLSTQPELARYGGRYLESYLYFRKQKKSISELIRGWGVKDFILDSGAFTAYTQGEVIDIREYGETILANKEVITQSANLDVIGNPEETYKNWLLLTDMGCNTLPVIHYGANKKWFDVYLGEHKVKYLALGGLVPYVKKKTKIKKWLDYCYSILKNYPEVKVHLFGVTTNWILQRYPIYSCDSTGWLYAGKRGRIVVFEKGNIIPHTITEVLSRTNGYKENNTKSALAYMKYEKHLTKLWEKRGVKWK